MKQTLHGKALIQRLAPQILIKIQVIRDLILLCRIKHATLVQKDNAFTLHHPEGVRTARTLEELLDLKIWLIEKDSKEDALCSTYY